MKRIHGGQLWEAGGDFLDFSCNLNPYAPSGKLKRFLKEVPYNFFTTHPKVYPEKLEKSLANKLSISPDNLALLPGAIFGIHVIFQILKPDRVLIPIPTFNEYERLATVFNAKIKYHRLREEMAFKLCLGEIAASIEEGDLVFICNPNNPTGYLFSKEETEALIRWIKNKNVTIIFDEAFIEFTNSEGAYKYAVTTPQVIVLRSFTKIHSIPGIRLGYMIGEKGFIEKVKNLIPSWSITRIAEEAGILAIEEEKNRELWIEKINQQKTVIISELTKLGFKIFPSSCNFLLIKTPEKIEAPVLERLLFKHKILIRTFPEYEFLNKKFFRISVKDEKANKYLIKILKEVLEGESQ